MKKNKICLTAIQDTGTLHNIYIHPTQNISIIKSPPPSYDPAGGMAILVLNQIINCITPIPQTLPPNKMAHRIQSVTISTPKKIEIHNAYCQSNSKEIGERLLAIASDKPAIILGDLNSVPFPTLDRINSDGTKGTKNTYPVANLLEAGWIDTYRHINEDTQAFTRWGKTTSKEGVIRLTASRIDHILVSPSLMSSILQCTIIEHDAVSSDHRLVICNIESSFNPNSNTNSNTITYREGLKDPAKWQEYSKLLEIAQLPQSNNINEMATAIRESITDTFNKVFTQKTIHHFDPIYKLHNSPRYKTIKKAKKATFNIIKKIIFQNLTLCYSDIQAEAEIIEQHLALPAVDKFDRGNVALLYEIETRLGRMARACAREYKREVIKEKMNKLLPHLDQNGHNVFKLLKQTAHNNIACVFLEDEVLLEQNEIETCLNDTWGKTFKSTKSPTLEVNKFIKEVPKPPANTKLPTPDFTTNNIRRILLSKTPTSPGHTGVTWRMLAKAPETMLQYISELLQNCYKNNVAPDQWFEGITVLIPKPNTPPTPGGFRPITLLPVEYKLYSQILTDSLTEWLYEHNIIPRSQNGARPERGCDTSLWSYLSVIRDAKISNRELHSLYIDYSKAFDSVEHWVFELIFTHLNIGKLGTVIHSLLAPAITKLKINDTICPQTIKFERGTKQGDVISPILFLLFMAPLLHTIQNKCKGYHNPDTAVKLTCSAIMDDVLVTSDSRTDAKKAVKIITEYAHVTGMDINPKKSAYAWLNTTQPITPKYNNIQFDMLGETQPYKYLGVWISLNLDWATQQQVLEQSTYSILGMLTRKFYLSGAMLARLINATIVAIFSYRMQVIKFDTNWLLKIQTIITRALNKSVRLTYKTSCFQWCLMQGLNWLPNINILRYVASLRRNIMRPPPDDAAWNIISTIATPTNYLCPGWPNPKDTLNEVGLKPFIAWAHPYYQNPSITDCNITTPPVAHLTTADTREGFTDGSLKRANIPTSHTNQANGQFSQMAAAVWDRSMNAPISFPVHGPPSSTEAELQGILYYINANPNTRGLTIYSDSESAINLTNKVKYIYNNLNKFQNRVTLRKLREALKDRVVIPEDAEPPPKPHRYVTLKHIYSHKTKNSKEYADMKEKYGDKIDWILEGNRQVDVAAKEACHTPIIPFPISMQPHFDTAGLVEYRGGIILSLNKYLKRLLTLNIHKEWAAAEPTKANRLLNPLTDVTSSLQVIQNTKCNRRANSTFALKLALCQLPTRPTVRRSTHPDKLRMPFYESDFCKYCQDNGANRYESHDHVFWECPAAKYSIKPMETDIIAAVNKIVKKKITTLPWWFPTDTPSWTNNPSHTEIDLEEEEDLVDLEVREDLEEPRAEANRARKTPNIAWAEKFEKAWGIRGFVPAGLTNFLRHWTSKAKAIEIVHRITDIIAERNQKVWIHRCKYMFDKNNYPPDITPRSPSPPPYSPLGD